MEYGSLGISALLVSGLGVLVSLRAENVRQAYQRMSLGFLIIWLPLTLGPQFLPRESQARIGVFLSGLNLAQVALIAASILVVLDALLIGLSMARFQRSRLISE